MFSEPQYSTPPRLVRWSRWAKARVPLSTESATVLISLIALVFILAQVWVYNEQRKIMSDTRTVLVQQTQLMKQQTDLMRMSLLMNRAYVGVASLTANVEGGQMTIVLENIGKIPADKISVDVREIRRTGEDSLGSTYHVEIGQQLVPGTHMQVRVPLSNFGPTEAENITAKKERLYIIGTINYEDGFGNPAITKFAFEWNPPRKEDWTPLPELTKED